MRTCRRVPTLLALLLLALALSACGSLSASNDGGGDDDDDDVTGDGGAVDASFDAPLGPCERSDLSIDEFYDCTTEGIEGLFTRCIGDIGTTDFGRAVDFQFFGDISVPVSRAFLPDAIARGTLVYDPEAARDCLELLAGIDCSLLFSNDNPFEQCRMFQGQVDPGSSCFNDLECIGAGAECNKSACTDSSDLCCAGLCIAPVPLNGSCAGTESCVTGAHCVNGFCASGEQNAPCSDNDDQCDVGFWCNATICSTDFQPEASCTKEAQCPAGHSCIGENPGTGAAGTCVDVRVVGNACEGSGTFFSNGCFNALFCDIPLGGTEGTCQEFPEVGETCETSDEDTQICPFLLTCDDNACANRGNIGEACDNNSSTGACNQDLFCTTEINGQPTGQCAAPQTVNSTCNSDRQCATGICDFDLGRCAAYSSCFL
jgi:hypothetical protein